MKLKKQELPEMMKRMNPDGKCWSYGEINVMQTVDDVVDNVIAYNQFGTTKMPKGKYKHTSVSHPSRYPTWDELSEIKRLVHGDVLVVQVLPPRSHYTNVHKNCFHLWELPYEK